MTRVKCELSRILIIDDQQLYMVELRELDGERRLEMQIGFLEIMTIQRNIDGITLPRPLTHDLMVNMLKKLSLKIVEVCVTDICVSGNNEGTFYGEIVVEDVHGNRFTLDSRPSDAIALSTRFMSPIYVSERVFTKLGL